jgi:hypothetical protein
MGAIAGFVPKLPHPYRQMPEPFPSFAYGARLWRFTGRLVSWRDVDSVPTGFSLGERPLHALANTAGSGSVLFLRTDRDRGTFAIYR